MRSILILTAVIAPLFLCNAAYAQNESYDDCKQSCVDDQEARNMECPSPYDESSTKEERDQCLKDSRDAYNSCLSSCPQASPPTPSSTPIPLGY